MLLKGKRVFIVEDSVLNRTIFDFILKIQGAKIEFDTWGKNTMEKIAVLKPDVIILDLMLPMGASGYDVFSKIRANSDYNAIPIVAVSASEPAIAIVKTKNMGFSGFISKPIDEAIFAEQIAEILSGKQIWSAGKRYL